ncbi:fatty acid desaturase [Rhodobacteraceae bacterium N5(2021)]|uniref:Fatty acid desaturase n=1 Tax=Gymnodinialimonas phycosphaerae TaxID=2841589 RepID=A0A975TY44_9RHOB|nr:fatty acid desaturase [Gymnodinialimonas phycosphaerae]MBY4892840.1 fatty acid desaturase [Gymnodinialimonas phycosphaerae]
MHAISSHPEITQTYTREAEREIRRFTRDWTKRNDTLAATSYALTFIAYFSTLALSIWAWPAAWAVVPLIVLNAFIGVRLYVLQHDTGHNSLFSTSRMNTIAGHGLSVFTLTPFAVMQHNHNAHHSHLGNLDARDTTEIFTMTLREWQEASTFRRLFYRLYRHPLLLIPVGGIYTYAIAYRWPKNAAKVAPFQVLMHNVGLALWVLLLWYIAGIPGLVVYGGTVFAAGCIGVFLVYLQHNFEDTWWDRKPDLNPARAALQGSSALDLGWWFDLAVANITYHDIHHFNANIPSYRLRECHRALRQHYEVQTIGWGEALRSFTLKLWDENQGRLVAFPKAQEQRVPVVPAE